MERIVVRKSDNAVINVLEIACGECVGCIKEDICFIVEKPDGFEFTPSFTRIKWIYNSETNDFECTNEEMIWE